MCGIAGIFYFDNVESKEQQAKKMAGMLNLIRHRGPDDYGIESVSERLILGHRRLSIIDVSKSGHQPMTDHGRRNWIAFNGEVYNYIEIRRELISVGYEFSTDTDTEVVLTAYEHWGTRCFAKFNGMWAIAIWDANRDHLILSKDRSGMKPLYYFMNKEFIIFASEIKSVAFAMEQSGVKMSYNFEKIAHFINHGQYGGFIDHYNEHPFEQIQDFKHNHFMVIDILGRSQLETYWSLHEQSRVLRDLTSKLSFQDKSILLKETLYQSVKRHLRSDVPIGISLSGGLDSSAIAAFASDIHPTILNTYSIDYYQYDCGEGHFAREINDLYQFKANMIHVNGQDFLDDLEELIWMREVPSNTYALISMWNVMKTATKDITVLLSGQGSDEILAGYHYYYSTYLSDVYAANNSLKEVREALVDIKDKTEPYLYHHIEQAAMNIAGHQQANNQFSGEFNSLLDNHLYQSTSNLSLPRLLMNEDRCSMAFSIESRLPFLDYEFLELCFALDFSDKIYGGWTKYILRDVMSPFLPNAVCWRKEKKGYATPFSHWIIQNNGFIDILKSAQKLDSFVDRKQLNIFISQLETLKMSKSIPNPQMTSLLWRLINLEIWLRTYQRNVLSATDDRVIQ